MSIFNTKYDVVFYYPQHFNRSVNGTNPFFDPLIAVCEENKLRYIIIEEPDGNTNYPRDKRAKPFKYIYIIYFFRKILPISLFGTFTRRDKFIAKIVKPFFFRNFKFDNFITISNSMLSFFKGLNSNAELFDYQHGLVFSDHIGYFQDQKPHQIIQECNSNVLVYGNGFKQLLIKGNKDYFQNHVYSIGLQENKSERIHSVFNKNVLVSLQFCGSEHVYWFDVILNYLVNLFEENKEYFIENEIRFYLKHHPRFENNIDISSLLQYSFVEEINDSIVEIINVCSVHLTYHSSTTFEVSKYGIPTFFIPDVLYQNVFFKEFNYPLKSENFVAFINSLMLSNGYDKNTRDIMEWYKMFYSEFDEKKFLNLLKK